MVQEQTDLPTVYELVVQAGPRAGQVIVVDRAVLRIGRQTTNDLVLPDAKVSRLHARLEQQGDGLLVTDEGSSNGTYVNGARISTPTMLQTGDILAVGASHLRVQAVVAEGVPSAHMAEAPAPAAAPGSPPQPAAPNPPTAAAATIPPVVAGPGAATTPVDHAATSTEKVPSAPAAPTAEPAHKGGFLQRLLSLFKRGG
jgi:predicted component of type VI protein secretion system